LEKVEEICLENKNSKGVVSFKKVNYFQEIKENTGSEDVGHVPEISTKKKNDCMEKNSHRQLLAHAKLCVDPGK
jgi:hypothetical protein